jgi:hypothetical protein
MATDDDDDDDDADDDDDHKYWTRPHINATR